MLLISRGEVFRSNIGVLCNEPKYYWLCAIDVKVRARTQSRTPV